MLFVRLYNLPILPFQEHPSDMLEPNEATDFEALEDTVNTVVKFPGASNDKYLGEPNA